MTADVGCISDGQEAGYRELVNQLVALCGNNHFTFNKNNTKGMMVEFRRNRNKPNTISNLREEAVENYIYLGVNLDNRLEWRLSTGRDRADSTS